MALLEAAVVLRLAALIIYGVLRLLTPAGAEASRIE
jgi:hypothetical protein